MAQSKSAKLRQQLVQSHQPQRIARRLSQGPGNSYLRDFIYGAIDGLITTFAIVAGVAGAGLSVSVVVVLGLANLLADGFSMGASNFLGVRADNQRIEKTRRQEHLEVELYPEGEREEIRQIFAAKGFSGAQLEDIVATITDDKKLWVDTMLQDEHGFSLQQASPLKAGLATLSAFVLLGALPLLPFLLGLVGVDLAHPYRFSLVLTFVGFALVGAAKGRQVGSSAWISALETLAIGGAAAGLAYWVGALISGL
ncbi:VIT1/CCC1 transporter family protein [Gilvimarinus xylanilyticus]|uniref:VIT1/CCC1 transporter family protein n=1 Tax=Gilvimarinus xylanilyticus TaxID=2944139 RepID=A0A9X2KTG2_9GAMM|nr:VIT1/CCC1 transporter family protein [Gilvimarinus xylanilyticus]MCP8899172.1 VIT1/CCC1 transporter family protein [Gilvimarinus xylanilyticus]